MALTFAGREGHSVKTPIFWALVYLLFTMAVFNRRGGKIRHLATVRP